MRAVACACFLLVLIGGIVYSVEVPGVAQPSPSRHSSSSSSSSSTTSTVSVSTTTTTTTTTTTQRPAADPPPLAPATTQGRKTSTGTGVDVLEEEEEEEREKDEDDVQGDTPGAMIRHVCATNSQPVNIFGAGLDTSILDPDRRAYHSIAQVVDPYSKRQYALLYGGCGGNLAGYAQVLSDIWVYDPLRRIWFKVHHQPLAPFFAVPAARFGHAASTLQDTTKVLVFGGVISEILPTMNITNQCDVTSAVGFFSNETWVLSFNSSSPTTLWTAVSLSSAPAPRARHTMVSVGGQVILFGGVGGPEMIKDHSRALTVYGDVWVFNEATMAWGELGVSGPGPAPRFAHTAVAMTLNLTGSLAPYMVVFGGRDATGLAFNDVWALSLTTKTWTRMDLTSVAPNKPTPRYDHASIAALNSTVFLVHGGKGIDPSEQNRDSWQYNVMTSQWSRVQPWFTAQMSSSSDTEMTPLSLYLDFKDVWGHSLFVVESGGASGVYRYFSFGGMYGTANATVSIPTSDCFDLRDFTAANGTLVWDVCTPEAAPFSRAHHRAVTVGAGQNNMTFGGCKCLPKWDYKLPPGDIPVPQYGCSNPFGFFNTYWCKVDEQTCATARLGWVGDFNWDYCGDNEMLVYGGVFNGDHDHQGIVDPPGTVWVYNPALAKWRVDTSPVQAGPLPVPRFDHGMVRASLTADVWGTSEFVVLVYGGQQITPGDGPDAILNDTWVYHYASSLLGGSWRPVTYTTATAMVMERTQHTIVQYGRKAYVFGGLMPCANPNQQTAHSFTFRSDNAPCLETHWSQFVSLDLHTWQWEAIPFTPGQPSPPARSNHAAEVVALMSAGVQVIVIVGGISAIGEVLQDTWLYNFVSESWSSLPQVSFQGRFGHTAVGYGSKLLVFGGKNVTKSEDECIISQPSCSLSDLWELELNTSSNVPRWTKLSCDSNSQVCALDNPKLAFHSATTIGGLLYVFGGIEGMEESVTSTLMKQSVYKNTINVVTPWCNKGAFSPEYYYYECEECPLGFYSANSGSCQCQRCPGESYTNSTGASTVLDCSACLPGICNHGTCNITVQSTGSCTCKPGFISVDRCAVPWLFIAPCVFIVVVALASWGLNKYLHWNKLVQRRKLQFNETQKQIEHVSGTCVIPAEEIVLLELLGGRREVEIWSGTWGATKVAIRKLFFAQGAARESNSETEAFVQVAQSMRSIRHPNIVEFMGGADLGGHMLLVYEFVQFGDLRRILLDATVSLDLNTKLRFALDAAKGLRFLHLCSPARPHMELQTSSLLVTDRWVVKVTGFEPGYFAREAQRGRAPGTGGEGRGFGGGDSVGGVGERQPLLQGSVNASTGTQARIDNRISSRIEFVAPEILRGEHPGIKSDTYAFGIILWEIYTRKGPYMDMLGNLIQLIESVKRQHRPKIPLTCPKLLAKLIEACWSDNASQRPDFVAIVQQLDVLQDMSLISRQTGSAVTKRVRFGEPDGSEA